MNDRIMDKLKTLYLHPTSPPSPPTTHTHIHTYFIWEGGINIVRIFQSVWELWCTQAVPTKKLFWGDNYKMKKVRAVILTRDTLTEPDLHLYQVLS